LLQRGDYLLDLGAAMVFAMPFFAMSCEGFDAIDIEPHATI